MNDTFKLDFNSPQLQYRLKNISWRKEAIARACGMKSKKGLHIIDATGGLAQDAFILAYLGNQVTLLERHETLAKTVSEALQQYKIVHPDFSLQVMQADSIHYLNDLPPEDFPDVIYLDPMYPESNKTAKAKKSMEMIRSLVGDDPDQEKLFQIALRRTKQRVVVKRPLRAPLIASEKPHHQIVGKVARFDVYLYREEPLI